MSQHSDPASGEVRPEGPAGTPDQVPGEARAAPAGRRTPSADPPTVLSHRRPSTPESAPLAELHEIVSELRGQRLGYYQLEDYIGGGAMGAVFRARDSRLSRLVALKVLPQKQAADPEVAQRFDKEARAAAQLDHENIARVYDLGADQGLHYIAFEYVQGTNLRDVIAQSGRLPLAEAVNYTLQIAGALVHAASRNVVHRDIKPSNVIITPAGRAKLVDMGLARHFRRDESALTQGGTTLGTFDYMSPEQARDARVADVRSDIYSLGCTLYHMLTGETPFSEGTVAQILLAHQEEEPPDPRAHNSGIPDDLAAIVRKMMAKKPGRRYQDPEQLYRDLLLVAGSLGLRSTSPEGLVWMSAGTTRVPAWERHLVWAVPAATLLAVVALLPFVEHMMNSPSPTGSRATEAVAQRETRPRTVDPFLVAEADRDDGIPEMATGQAPGESDQVERRGERTEVPSESEPTESPASSPPGNGRRATPAGGEMTTEQPLGVAQRNLPRRGSGPAGDEDAVTSARAASDRADRLALRESAEVDTSAVGRPGPNAERSFDAEGQSGDGRASRGGLAPPRFRGEIGISTVPEVGLSEPLAVEDEASGPEMVRQPREGRTESARDSETAPAGRPRTPGSEPAVASATREERLLPSAAALQRLEPTARTAPAARSNVLVVDPSSTEDAVFANLERALHAADNGSIIELRYDGRQPERPVSIRGIGVTVRPAPGFEPVVELRPREVATQGFDTRLVTVAEGGSLSMVNLHLDIEVPNVTSAQPWSAFHVQRPKQLKLEGCTVTLRNSFAQDAAFFEVGGAVGGGAPGRVRVEDVEQGPVELDVTRCFLRGDADVILVNQPQSMRISLAESVLAASGRLLRVRGGPSAPHTGEVIDLRMDHLTARTDAGLLLMEQGDVASHLLPVRMTYSNNIFWTRGSGTLITLSGPGGAESLRGLIQDDYSSGEKNFFEGYEVFREIQSAAASTMIPGMTDPLDFDAWRTVRGRNEVDPHHNEVRWARAALTGTPLAQAKLDDFALADGLNPARQGASDGRDVGADLARVPSPLVNGQR